MILTTALKRAAMMVIITASTAILLGCGSSLKPKPYVIDTRHQAVSQSERIEYVVLHYTAEDDENSLDLLTNANVSSHYLIPLVADEKIYQLVADDKKAWHAGISQFAGKSGLNDISIGIEIVNAGVKNPQDGEYLPADAYVAYSPQQMEKLAWLLQELIAKYRIKPTNIVAHADIAPTRKIDPGAKFPWRQLYERYGIGAWYDEKDKQAFVKQLSEDQAFERTSPRTIKAELRRYGYAINDVDTWDKPSRDVVYAFQLHFRPDNPTGVMDIETLAILRALNKKYR